MRLIDLSENLRIPMCERCYSEQAVSSIEEERLDQDTCPEATARFEDYP